MSVIQGLEWTFHTVAEEYNRWRPGYVPELYQDLFAYKPLNKSSSALEIGIGTGQATAPVLETGCALTAGRAWRFARRNRPAEIQPIPTFYRDPYGISSVCAPG